MMLTDVEEIQTPMILGYRSAPTPEQSSTPSASETIKAAFRTENTIGSFLNDDVEKSKPNPEFDPFDNIAGFEEYATSFVHTNSPEQVQQVKNQITREKGDKQLLQEAGWMGTAASIAAGILDPINLIPVGGEAIKAYTLGGSILKGAANTARAGLIGSSISEAALHSTQEARTLGESAANIAGATLLSGVLGGAAGLIGGKELHNLGRRVEKELEIPHPDSSDIAEPNSIVINDSVGAMRATVQTTLEEEALSKAWGVDKLFAKLNPKLRLATSPSVESRRFVQELVETPFYYEKNAAFSEPVPQDPYSPDYKTPVRTGIANPIAIETMVGMQDARMGRAVEFQKKAFADYRNRMKTEGGPRLSYEQFKEQAARATRRNDIHAVPEVSAVAKKYRSEILDPFKQAAIKVGLLSEDVKVETADSYLHRWWDKNIVNAKRDELRTILRGGLQGQYAEVQVKYSKKIAIQEKNLNSEIGSLKDANLRDNQQFIDSGGQFTETQILDAIRLIQSPPKQPETLISFLHKNGGLQDYQGELKNIGLSQKSRPGFVNKKGMNLDDATLKAWENGFFPQFQERPEINDLLDAIRNDYTGDLVVRQQDMDYAREVEHLSDIQRALDELGIDVERFKGVKRLADFNLGDVKKKINDITAARRGRKIEGLSKKLEDISGSKLDDLEDNEFDLMADEIIDNILGHADTRLPYDVPMAARGPLKDRTLSFVRDEDVEHFLVNDIEAVANKYVRTMAPDIAIKERFGDINILDKAGPIVTKINEEYRTLINQAKTTKEKKSLEKQRTSDLNDIDALVNQIRGTYGMPENPDSIIVRTGRSIRNLQYVSKLGGMTASAFSDIARPVMVHGISRTFSDGIVPLITNLKALKLSAREVKEAGAAWDMVLDSRAMTLAEITNPYVKGNKFEKGLQYLTDGFGKVTLMTQWNTALKQFSGVVTQGRIVGALQSGNISAKDARYLNMIGIDSEMGKRIAGQIAAFGDDFRGTTVVNTAKWTDLEAQRTYRAALKKEVSRIIVEPGHGDLPLILKSTEAGKMIGQFRSFSFAATNKLLISGLQEADLQALNGWILAVGMGMVSYAFKTWDRGEKLSDDPRTWIFEGVDRSGVLAILSEINQLSNKVSRGNISLQRLAGAPQLTRYASTNAWGIFLGPTVGTVADSMQVAGSALNAQWTKSDSRALRRMIPYQNLLLARQAFDQLEQSINETLGVKK